MLAGPLATLGLLSNEAMPIGYDLLPGLAEEAQAVPTITQMSTPLCKGLLFARPLAYAVIVQFAPTVLLTGDHASDPGVWLTPIKLRVEKSTAAVENTQFWIVCGSAGVLK